VTRGNGELPRQVGQLTIERDGDGWLIATAGHPADPATLETVREWSREDARGRYRPLPGARSLRPGLRLRTADIGDARDAVEAIYPLALLHFRQHAEGALRLVPLEESLARQTGRYEDAAALDDRGRAAVADVLCGQCVKTPLWREPSAPVESIPCPEACSVLIALCREAALWQQSLLARSAPDPDIPFAAFETAGNEVREAVIACMEGERLVQR
jgi:sirohydrochlorin cobaltochelatase